MTAALGSAPDPFVFNENLANGVSTLNTPFASIGVSDARGRTQQSSIVSDRANTKIIIVDGQSEHATSNGTATYATVSSQAQNFSLYDGAIYAGSDPVLGCTSSGGPSSQIMRIADRIIARGKASRVIMAPIAMGGTSWTQYDPAAANSLFTRVQSAILRLAARGLSPDAIIVGRGARDNALGTSAAVITAAIQAWATGVRNLGCTAPIYLSKYTMNGGSVSSTVQTGIANALSTPLNIVAGYDADTNLTVAGGFRLADGTHLSDTGLTAAANGIADLIYP